LGFRAGPNALDSKKKKLLPLPGIEPQFIGRLALSLIAVPMDLRRSHCLLCLSEYNVKEILITSFLPCRCTARNHVLGINGGWTIEVISC
jgi:hypothetical protein